MPGRLGRTAPAPRGTAVDHAAAGDDQRTLRRRDEQLAARSNARRVRAAAGGCARRVRRTAIRGQSNASACTSCGIAIVTAPVSAGSVSTRIAPSSAAGSCSGRHTRSKYRDTGPERVVDGDVAGVRALEFLQHGRADPGGERVAGQQQHRYPVDGGQRGTGDHVRRAGPDRRGDRPGLQAVLHPGVADGASAPSPARCGAEHVGQGLRVAEFLLQQGLPEPGHVAVPEDAKAAREEPVSLAVAFGVLGGKESDGGLSDGEADGGSWPWLVSRNTQRQSRIDVLLFPACRSQSWCGSKLISQRPYGPDPAITLR